jgi:hypothetical protein
MFGVVALWDDASEVHMVSGADVALDSSEAVTRGVVADGCSGGGVTVCGERFYGVMGVPDGDPRKVAGMCVDCVAVFEAQRRHILPAGWTRDELLAYWRGFDHGAEYAGFMENHPVSEFGYVPMSTPDYIHGRDELRARFDEGAEDGVRAYALEEGWVPQW